MYFKKNRWVENECQIDNQVLDVPYKCCSSHFTTFVVAEFGSKENYQGFLELQ